MKANGWITQVRKGLLELCILNLLKHGELYGYDIVKQLSNLSDWDISGGTVYPILNRLKGEGSLTTVLKESELGPVRKYYGLSKKGQQKLNELNTNWGSLKEMMDGIIEEKKV